MFRHFVRFIFSWFTKDITATQARRMAEKSKNNAIRDMVHEAHRTIRKAIRGGRRSCTVSGSINDDFLWNDERREQLMSILEADGFCCTLHKKPRGHESAETIHYAITITW